MDTLLLVVTGLALAVAAAMGGLVLRLVREERRRSEARVAALLEALGALPDADPGSWAAADPARHAATVTARQVEPLDERRLPRAEAAADLPLRGSPAVSGLFAGPAPGRSWGPRIVVVAAVLAVLSGTAFTLLSSRTPDAGSAQADTREAGPRPIELLTLRHAVEAGSLTVSGIVQNPPGGIMLRAVTATAHAMGADGALLAEGRAPLDVVALGPGEESPFVVTVPVAGAVARYRVGFRTADGAVVAHVDRRSAAEALAQR